jgi:hypothetical protein
VERTSLRRNLATLSSLALASTILWARSASAEVQVLKSENGGWEFFTNGRINAFLSYARGDGVPVAQLDPVTMSPLWEFNGAGGTGANDSSATADPMGGQGHTQGTINSMRVRSGFVGNVLGFGLRRNFDATTKVTVYTSIWSIVESVARRKYFPDFADVREGYLKIEGPWGAVLAGKAGTLFNRGATEANYLYMHAYGLGYPGSVDVQGPAAGMIGYGILASTFSGGITYTTPSFAGVQLAAGVYDPANLIGSRYDRTGLVRPEFELTVDEPLGTLGKVHLYLNGTIQKLYAANQPDDPSETPKGYGAGGRVELGPVHLAGGMHRGLGLGLTFALEPSDSTYNDISQLRDSKGFYAIGQLALGKIDINAGYGQTQVVPLDRDLIPAPGQMYPKFSVIKTQTGIAGAVVFHAAEWLHFDVDVMHADYKWTLGDRQQVNFYNAGTTVTW